MDNMENGKKKFSGPLVYAILGVTILIVAVAGSAYAYFAASANVTGNISGETLDVKLSAVVTKVSGANGNLIPIHDGSNGTSQLSQAATANPSCQDTQGYTVCQIYSIVISNNGTDDTTVNTDVALTGSANLKWANMSNSTTVGAVHAKTDTSVATNTVVSGGGSTTLYIMVYINNTGGDQTSADAGKTVNGTFTITASTGDQIEAKF